MDIPPDLDSFVGREAELERIEDRLLEDPLGESVVEVGPLGVEADRGVAPAALLFVQRAESASSPVVDPSDPAMRARGRALA